MAGADPQRSRGEYPHLRVSGDPVERGVEYGRLARERIERSVSAYRDVFEYCAGWDWSDVRRYAATFEAPIRDFCAAYLVELESIARGAGLDSLDVLAINLRTEIMYSSAARRAECSAFALPGAPGSAAPVIVGQNWDWLPHSFDTVVVLEAEQEHAPNYVTVVEAGLLAKTGMNSAGLGLVTNALASDRDLGAPGVPYHVLLRAILDCSRVSEAFEVVANATRSSSANYLVAHADGSVLDVEATPGGFAQALLAPDTEVITHTNHFLAPTFQGRDVSLWTTPDSPVRLSRLRRGLAGVDGSLDSLRPVLTDHANLPFSICAHPHRGGDPRDQGATIASVVMDLHERRIWLSDGPPCQVDYRELDCRSVRADTVGAPA